VLFELKDRRIRVNVLTPGHYVNGMELIVDGGTTAV
jgi:hypothetical protein